MPYFKSFDDKNIYYIEHQGIKKINIIFLHGWTSTAAFNDYLIKELKEFNVYMWDARSHGKSDVDEDVTIQKMAKDLYHFLAEVPNQDNQNFCIGHSMGALVLMEYMREFQGNNISKLGFIDQSPKLITDKEWKLGIYGNFPESLNEEMIKSFEENLAEGHTKLGMKGLNKEYKERVHNNPEILKAKHNYLKTLNSKAIIQIWKDLSVKDYRDVIKKIKLPTLLLYGLKSQYYLKETGTYMQDQIENSELMYFEKGDHSPFVEETEKFCNVVRAFALK